jgi:hypothetical protein
LISFSQCQLYDGDLAGAYVGWVAAKKPQKYVPVTPGSRKPYGVRECDQGWIYNLTFRTLSTEVIIVIQNKKQFPSMPATKNKICMVLMIFWRLRIDWTRTQDFKMAIMFV